MSAGRWNYIQDGIPEALSVVGEDAEVVQRFPQLAARLRLLSGVLFDAIYEIDLDFCGDKRILDDWEFEKRVLSAMRSEE